MANRKALLVSAGMAAVLGPGVWVYTQQPQDAVFAYESSLSVSGRILDVAVFRDNVYVLTGDSRGSQIHRFDETGSKVSIVDAKTAIALAPDPSTGLAYLLATTRKRGPFHYIYSNLPWIKRAASC